jgi:hypothetical protein
MIAYSTVGEQRKRGMLKTARENEWMKKARLFVGAILFLISNGHDHRPGLSINLY